MIVPDEREQEAEEDVEPGGCCCGDPYAGLPPEVRPAPATRNDGLRQATCPRCGLVYTTNRGTNVCIKCE